MNNLDQKNNDPNHLKTSDINQPLRIHFRCPDCSKLYSSDPEKIYVENPEYTCTACGTDFSVSLIQALENSEVVGVKKQNPKPSDTVDLPVSKSDDERLITALEQSSKKTISELSQELDERPRSKADFRELVESRFVNTLELMWQDVLSDYENREVHSAFIKACKSEGHLDFALHMYGNILKHSP